MNSKSSNSISLEIFYSKFHKNNCVISLRKLENCLGVNIYLLSANFANKKLSRLIKNFTDNKYCWNKNKYNSATKEAVCRFCVALAKSSNKTEQNNIWENFAET